MLVYLVNTISEREFKAFTNKQLAKAHLEEINKYKIFKAHICKIELVTDEFIQQIIQPKEQHEINTNSSIQ